MDVFFSPTTSRGNPFVTLDLVARTADSICDGDLVEKRIRAQSKWELLPLQVKSHIDVMLVFRVCAFSLAIIGFWI